MDSWHSSFLRSGDSERRPLPTLDDIDIEALILSYKPMLHPSVREGLEDQYSLIEAARRAGETRISSGSLRMSRSQASSSAQPRPRPAFSPPSAISRPLQGSTSTARPASSTPIKPILKRSSGSSSSASKTHFLSGEIAPDGGLDGYSLNVLSAEEFKNPSQPPKHSYIPRNDSTSSARQYSEATTFLTGSISRARGSERVTSTSSRSPLSSPPISSIPSRFTQSTSPDVGPGSMYRSGEPNAFSAPQTTRRTTSVETSPRSSLSSIKSNLFSVRWSSGSSKTASTARSISQASAKPEILEIRNRISKEAPHLDHIDIDANETFGPAAFSWLSFDEEQNDDSVVAPLSQRKNSLWRESFDSIASSRLGSLDDEEDIRARHFPTPTPSSRSNSIAITMTPESERQDPLDGSDEINSSPASRSWPSESSAAKRERSTNGKAPISEMLRVHVISPLSRSGSITSIVKTQSQGM